MAVVPAARRCRSGCAAHATAPAARSHQGAGCRTATAPLELLTATCSALAVPAAGGVRPPPSSGAAMCAATPQHLLLRWGDVAGTARCARPAAASARRSTLLLPPL